MNDLELAYNPYASNCAKCKHYKGVDQNGNPNCKAFEVIPVDILQGTNKHLEPTKEQTNDVVFSPRK